MQWISLPCQRIPSVFFFASVYFMQFVLKCIRTDVNIFTFFFYFSFHFLLACFFFSCILYTCRTHYFSFLLCCAWFLSYIIILSVCVAYVTVYSVHIKSFDETVGSLFHCEKGVLNFECHNECTLHRSQMLVPKSISLKIINFDTVLLRLWKFNQPFNATHNANAFHFIRGWFL